MRIPKVYGKSKDSDCPFCGSQTTCENPQGIAVCRVHKEQHISEVKCICGSWLEPKSGKFGRYYNCINCGNVSENKVLQIKEMTSPTLVAKPNILHQEVPFLTNQYSDNSSTATSSTNTGLTISKRTTKKEITISSRDHDYFD